jgi:penicillin-binding protein 2
MLTPAAFEDRRMGEGRLIGLRAVVMVCFGALAVSFWLLQVVQHDKYEEISANNHLKTITLRAPRGVLFDRTGRVLVENTRSFTIAIIRERTAHLDETIRRVAEVTGVSETRIREAVQRRRGEAPFRPLPVIEHATFAQVAAVAARRRELPEVEVQKVPARSYWVCDFLFGYVGGSGAHRLGNSRTLAAAGAIIGSRASRRSATASRH